MSGEEFAISKPEERPDNAGTVYLYKVIEEKAELRQRINSPMSGRTRFGESVNLSGDFLYITSIDSAAPYTFSAGYTLRYSRI
ncbi:MAG: hypothetical protein R2827_15080 [Bdellovibrionales bacterium]